jgi:hypothetical protein
VRLDQVEAIGDEFPSRNDISQLTADGFTRPRRTSCGAIPMGETTDDALSDLSNRKLRDDERK